MSKETSARRRTRDEIAHLMEGYEGSGLSRAAFCRAQGLSLSTLSRYLQRARSGASNAAAGGPFVAVQISRSYQTGGSGLAVILVGGRRLEIQRGFDAATLEQLVPLLERL